MVDKVLIFIIICLMIWSFVFGAFLEYNYHFVNMHIPDGISKWLGGFIGGMCIMEVGYILKKLFGNGRDVV